MKRLSWHFARRSGFTVLDRVPRGLDLFHDMRTALGLEGTITAFDVGANVGLWSADFLKAFPQGRVRCFEPNAELHDALSANLPPGSQHAIVRDALGDIEGEVSFVLTDEPTIGYVQDGQRSHAGVKARRTITVQATTLDAYCEAHSIDTIDILKIDTEGADLKVLGGARKTLARGVVRLVECECGVDPDNAFHVPLAQIGGFLEPFGFRMFGLYEQQPEWTTGQPHLRRVNAVFLLGETQHGNARAAGAE
ncbi:MAG: FkbM family methyltransferase [Alteraurantiacibacter sp.]